MLTSTRPPQRSRQHPRIVANLAVSEIIVVWALRHSLADNKPRGETDARIAPEFARALGLARLEKSLASLATLVDCLAVAGRRPQVTAAIDDDRVTVREEAVLALLSAYQHDDAALAAGLGDWLVIRSEQRRFTAAARALAEIMAEAGQFIPPSPPSKRPRGPRALSLRQGGFKPSEPERLPSVNSPHDLTGPERHLLDGLRLWLQAFKKNGDTREAVRRHFGAPAGTDPGLGLHTVLRNTTLAASRAVDVRCRHCPGLSPDEARLLDAVAWLQREAVEPAAAALSSWLPPSALRLTLDAARGLATGLLLQGRTLPLRDWDFTALEAAAHPPPPVDRGATLNSATSPTLH